ncbi:hypothetical protein ARZXY2_1585 [Arthrobacter sp. ZXY-2]|nr:hypothetical protein ARZXY2_1585 [Arthrobacter sp. ZXY-2]
MAGVLFAGIALFADGAREGPALCSALKANRPRIQGSGAG